MIVYIVDRQLNILGHASTNLPAGHGIVSDNTVEDVDTGVSTFDCSIAYTKETRAEVENLVQVGRYVLKKSGRSNSYDSLFQIIETEFDTLAQEVRLYAEDAGMDLLNTICPAVTLTGTLPYMMRYFLPSDWELNAIDAPTNSYTWTWDGESTATERLMSVAGIWNCELYYSFDIDGLRVTAKKVNVVKKRGSQTPIANLRLDYDINRIFTKTSIADLVTALDVTGGTPEDSETPINLVGYNYSYTDPATGDVYKVDTATGQMRNTSAMKRWSSAIDTDGLWIGSFQFDTTDKAVLAGQARARLQELSAVMVNYEVDFQVLPKDARIGDRVTIIDNQGNLYLEARLLRIETSASNNTQTATIGEYLLRSGGISEKVVALSAQLQNQISIGKSNQVKIETLTEALDTMSTLEATSETFANYTTLYAHVYRGTEEITNQFDAGQFKWINRSENGEEFLGRGYSITIDMNIVGYASTVLLKFVRPTLYNLTDHLGNDITDHNLEPIQVAYAGIYEQPIQTRSLLKTAKSALKAPLRATVQSGFPNITREVNLYEKDSIGKMPQHFWVDSTGETAGVHITEIPKAEFRADPENGGGNLLATSTGINVRDGLTDLASFGADASIVGKETDTHMRITPRAMNLRDGKGTSYLFAGVYNDAQGLANVQISYNAGTTEFTTTLHAVAITSATYADDSEATVSISDDGYSFIVSNIKNQVLTIHYVTDSPAPYYTFGRRRSGTIGFFSTTSGLNNLGGGWASICTGENNSIKNQARASALIGGQRNVVEERGYRAVVLGGADNVGSGWDSLTQGMGSKAQGRYQTVLGCYNIPSGTQDDISATDNLFIIGNGSSDTARSNAVTVKWTGDTTIAGTLTQSSDRRLKDHIKYLDQDADEFIRNLKPAYYRKDEQNHVGFYAQDVEAIDTWQCMTGEMNGFMTLGYTELIAPLVRYCQHLEERIAELEKGKE